MYFSTRAHALGAVKETFSEERQSINPERLE